MDITSDRCGFYDRKLFVTEKLSPSELNQIAELSEEELKRIIDRGLKNAETRIEDAIDEQVDQSSEKVDRSLEK